MAVPADRVIRPMSAAKTLVRKGPPWRDRYQSGDRMGLAVPLIGQRALGGEPEPGRASLGS